MTVVRRGRDTLLWIVVAAAIGLGVARVGYRLRLSGMSLRILTLLALVFGSAGCRSGQHAAERTYAETEGIRLRACGGFPDAPA